MPAGKFDAFIERWVRVIPSIHGTIKGTQVCAEDSPHLNFCPLSQRRPAWPYGQEQMECREPIREEALAMGHQRACRTVHILFRLRSSTSPLESKGCHTERAQGMMGGVNNAYDYYHNTMKFGYRDPETGSPVVTNSLLQGGIVRRRSFSSTAVSLNMRARYLSTTWAPWSDVSLAGGSEIATAASKLSLLALPGPSWAPVFNRAPKMRRG